MISIKKHSGIYTLKVMQHINTDLNKAWDFFSMPTNLEKITPTSMKFHITSENVDQTYAGQIISYEIGIISGIKSNWITEITQFENKKYFIDEQRFGPYKMWHHLHHFESTTTGILMTDIVNYKLPFGFIGHIIHALFIKAKLIDIFNYRMKVLPEIFNSLNEFD